METSGWVNISAPTTPIAKYCQNNLMLIGYKLVEIFNVFLIKIHGAKPPLTIVCDCDFLLKVGFNFTKKPPQRHNPKAFGLNIYLLHFLRKYQRHICRRCRFY
jgi:hypothetical protein